MGLLVLALSGTGVGCGLLRRQRGGDSEGVVEDMRRGRRPMGQVAVVEVGRGFVLVRSPLAATTEAESELVVKSRGSAETVGRLKASPERKRNMVAADIVEGAPKVGDVVFYVSGERVVSTVPPPVEGAVEGAAGVSGGIGIATEAGGALSAGDEWVGPTSSGSGSAGHGLPPLGEPSGPLEVIPDFPGLEPVPGGGGVEPLEEPVIPEE
ncbi:MAG: hypothetical protein ACKV19_17105 [Verrucomicrobiales bacterium]